MHQPGLLSHDTGCYLHEISFYVCALLAHDRNPLIRLNVNVIVILYQTDHRTFEHIQDFLKARNKACSHQFHLYLVNNKTDICFAFFLQITFCYIGITQGSNFRFCKNLFTRE
jgi:hypothetical protein